MLKRSSIALSAAVVAALGMSSAAIAGQTDRVAQDPAVGGQLNRCWGQVISQLAQLETETGTGGAMGQHARSTKAADINGGFAHTGNDAGVSFNVDGGRQGVGNVSADANGQHKLAPGDGGNGQHAINNAALATTPVTTQNGDVFLNPYSGEFEAEAEPLGCSVP